MDTSRRQRIDRLFTEALERAPAERAALLDERCGDDASLRAAVERLLASAEEDSDFLRPGGALQRSVWQAFSGEHDATVPPPQRVGVYRIVREIGRGGMSVRLPRRARRRRVRAARRREAHQAGDRYRGRAATLRAGAADPRVAESPGHRAALRRRFDRARASLFHYGATSRASRSTSTATHVRLELEARLELFVTVCEAVQSAHDKRIVHRDMKPSNILVSATAR